MQKTFHKALLFIITFTLVTALTNKSKWQNIGPKTTPMPPQDYSGWSPHGIGRIFDLVIHPQNPNKIWICSPNGGLFYTKNRGKNWSKLPMPCPGGAIHIALRMLKGNKLELVFASSSSAANKDPYSYGIFSTKNNGNHWDTIQKYTPSEYHLTAVKDLVFTHDTLIYIANNEIFSFKDGICNSLFKSEQNIEKIHINQLKHQWYFAGKTIIKSSNQGESFQSMNETNEQQTTISCTNSDVCTDKEGNDYALIYKEKNYWCKITENKITPINIIETSIDAGRTTVTFDPFRNQFLIGGIRLHSFDRLKTNQLTTPQYPNKNYCHDDIRAIDFDKNGHIYLGHDAGISVSEDGGNTWLLINGCGLNISEMYDFDIQERVILAGTQDNGNHLYKNKKWSNISELYGDGGTCLMTKNCWYNMIGTTLLKSETEGTNFENAMFPLRMSKFNPKIKEVNNTIYVADRDLWVQKYGEWTNISEGMEHGFQISGIAISADEKTIYVTKEDPIWGTENLKEKFYKSIDGGTTWKDITANFPSYSYRYISDIEINPNKPNELWACIGNFDSETGSKNRVFYTKDGGKTWENLSYNLPNIPCTLIKNITGIGLVLGTDAGLYRLLEKEWKPFGKDAPKAIITQIRPINDYLYISTYGSGLWRLKL